MIGDESPYPAGHSGIALTFDSGIGMLSSAGVSNGTILFQLRGMLRLEPGDGGCVLGVYFKTISVQVLKICSGM